MEDIDDMSPSWRNKSMKVPLSPMNKNVMNSRPQMFKQQSDGSIKAKLSRHVDEPKEKWFSHVAWRALFDEEQPNEELRIRKPAGNQDIAVGIQLMPGFPDIAVVRHVHRGSPAFEGSSIKAFDRILRVNNCDVTSAVHAVSLIRSSPAGDICRLVVRRCQPALITAAIRLQKAWRRRDYVSLVKPPGTMRIGIVFSDEWKDMAVVREVRDGPASGILREGDVVLSVNGRNCATPYEAACFLREATGRVRLHRRPLRYPF